MREKRTATLSSKYQISMPKSVRETHGWNPGQELAFIRGGKDVVVVPVPDLNDLKSIAKGADTAGYRDRDDRY